MLESRRIDPLLESLRSTNMPPVQSPSSGVADLAKFRLCAIIAGICNKSIFVIFPQESNIILYINVIFILAE